MQCMYACNVQWLYYPAWCPWQKSEKPSEGRTAPSPGHAPLPRKTEKTAAKHSRIPKQKVIKSCCSTISRSADPARMFCFV